MRCNMYSNNIVMSMEKMLRALPHVFAICHILNEDNECESENNDNNNSVESFINNYFGKSEGVESDCDESPIIFRDILKKIFSDGKKKTKEEVVEEVLGNPKYEKFIAEQYPDGFEKRLNNDLRELNREGFLNRKRGEDFYEPTQKICRFLKQRNFR